MKKVLLYIINSIASEPDKVSVDEEEKDGITNLTIKVAKDDMGRVIGKGGKIIRSIRNVLKIKAIKENKKINVILSETV